MSDFHVVVVGAGLGGLALAQGLRRAGITVTVYERDAALTSRRQGYRLHIDVYGRDAVARLLPPKLVRLFLATAGVPNARFTLLDEQLNQVFAQEAETPDGTKPEDLAQTAAGRELIETLGEYESEMIDYGFTAVRTGASNGQRILGQDPPASRVSPHARRSEETPRPVRKQPDMSVSVVCGSLREVGPTKGYGASTRVHISPQATHSLDQGGAERRDRLRARAWLAFSC